MRADCVCARMHAHKRLAEKLVEALGFISLKKKKERNVPLQNSLLHSSA